MRFIVLRSQVTKDGELILQGLTSLIQKSGGITDGWINISEAFTNCITPEKCDLLSFEDKGRLEEDLELWEIAAENVAIIGVEPE
jgi:hypothetical protein